MRNESDRIAKLFSDWYGGNPWTYVKLTDILKDLSAGQAAMHPIQNANSIWQLVQHCVGWRENVLRKMKGEEFKSPDDNYLNNPEDISEAAWKNLLERYEANEKEWQNYLLNVNDEILDEGYKPSKNEYSNYEVIHGLLHHDNYHFGQIVMLKKLVARG